MSRARILADYVAGGTTAAEFDYMDGVTSNVQTQLDAKAPLASPTFTFNFTSVGIDDNADATAITIDANENVGIGVTNPSDFNGGMDNLVVGNLTSGSHGITVASVASGYIGFADGSATAEDEYRGLVEYDHSDNKMHFRTDASQRLTIDSSGNVGIGATSSSLNNNQIWIDMANARYNVRSAGSASQDKKVFSLICGSNGEVGHITLGPSSTNFSSSSDYRLKENVVAMSGSITRLKELKPIKFNFIGWKDTTVDGFLAHEAKEVVPEAVVGEKDAVDDDGEIIRQGIDQSKLVPLLVGALQEAITRIEALESA